MISPQMDTDIVSPYPPTMQELERKVEDLERQVKELEKLNNDLGDSVSYHRSMVAAHETRVERLRNYVLKDMSESDNMRDISADAAETIADIMQFDLTKEHYFNVTVRFSGTVEVKPGEDVEDIISNMHYDMSDSYHTDVDFQLDDVSVDDVDIEEC